MSKAKIERDVCILEIIPNKKNEAFNLVPVKRMISFKKLKRGQFVRSFGSPAGLVGHTDTGSINFLGNAHEGSVAKYGGGKNKDGTKNFVYKINKDTKIIAHSAIISSGSSGGPLFNKSGDLIGLNTMGSGNIFFAVSADYVEELMRD